MLEVVESDNVLYDNTFAPCLNQKRLQCVSVCLHWRTSDAGPPWLVLWAEHLQSGSKHSREGCKIANASRRYFKKFTTEQQFALQTSMFPTIDFSFLVCVSF